MPLNLKMLADGIKLKNYLNKNPIKPIGEYSDVIPAKDGNGFLAVQEIRFATEKEAQFFIKLHEFVNAMEL
jgi:hypothetical protein